MKQTNKIKNAMNKAAREIPIIAWAVEVDGIINPSDTCRTRATARYVRRAAESFDEVKRAHVRKVVMYVIPGR